MFQTLEHLSIGKKEIYRFHLELWENQLYPILKEFRKSKKQFAETHIIKMYKNIEKMQKPYLRYLQNASEAIDYGMDLQKTTPSFQKYCNWCERKGLNIRRISGSAKDSLKIFGLACVFEPLMKTTTNSNIQLDQFSAHFSRFDSKVG